MCHPFHFSSLMIYHLLDIFFLVFHSALILFNLFGWIWKPLRKSNLITLALTGFSWLGLGIFYGIGYCPLTDWHWIVLYELGTPPQTSSYVAYLFKRVLSISITTSLADSLTTYSYIVALMLSIVVNIKGLKQKRK
jgi:hypothetical protein